jgi:hypothetical protein
MSKRVVKELGYDASPEEVVAMMTDTAFRERVLERMKVLRGTVTVEQGVVTLDQVQPAQGLPSFATKLVGDEIRILQVERWTSPTHADVDVTIPGKPGEMQGTIDLVASTGRTLEKVDMEITVRIPFVGGKIESLIGDMLSKALDTEHRAGQEWLAGR